MRRFSSCAAVASVFAPGDSGDIHAAVLCVQKHFALTFPGMQCVVYAVGVHGLPRSASVEVSLHVSSPCSLCQVEETDGFRLYRALNSNESQLMVAFIRDGDGAVAGMNSALALLGDVDSSSDIACTAWIAGSLQQDMAGILDADTAHNWSVLCSHGLCSCESMDAASSYAAVLSISRHTQAL